MKRSLFFLLPLLTSVCAVAQDYVYPYLTFTAADGTKTTVSVTNLEIMFADGQLTATNEGGTTKLTLADLSSMVFAASGETSPVGPEKSASGLTFANVDGELETVVGEVFTAPTLSNSNNLALTWTSSDESVATVDADGHVTIVGVGTVVITATFAGNDEYEAGSASYTIVVSGPVNGVSSLAADATVKVCTVSGVYVGTFGSLSEARAQLSKGLYVVNTGTKNIKMNIR